MVLGAVMLVAEIHFVGLFIYLFLEKTPK